MSAEFENDGAWGHLFVMVIDGDLRIEVNRAQVTTLRLTDARRVRDFLNEQYPT